MARGADGSTMPPSEAEPRLAAIARRLISPAGPGSGPGPGSEPGPGPGGAGSGPALPLESGEAADAPLGGGEAVTHLLLFDNLISDAG